ncbi:MAG: DNA-binding protein [Shinella sp.]|nr:MAG: DNA-binding protein [Shinella sp.]
MAKAGRGSEQVMIRLPDGMRDRIKEAAERNNRSMNAEIVAALEDAFPSALDVASELKMIDEIDEIRARLDRLRIEAARKEIENFDKIIENGKKLLGKTDEGE